MGSESVSMEKELLASLQQMAAAFSHFKIRYALIGGIAVGFRSRPRSTADLDFLLEVPQLVLPGLLEDLQRRGFQFDMPTTIREWTQDNMTVLHYGAIPIDWLKPVLPSYRHVLDTSRSESLLDQSVSVASVEGLILTKLISFRFQDKADIVSLLAANRDHVNVDWIRQEWKQLAEPDDGRSREFDTMLASLQLE